MSPVSGESTLDRAWSIAKRRLLAVETRRVLGPFGFEWLLYWGRYFRERKSTEAHRRGVISPSLLDDIRGKNLTFTVTAGRTGTLFLARLFRILPNTTSLHEPEPAFHRYLRSVQRDPSVARDFLLHYKLPFIAA